METLNDLKYSIRAEDPGDAAGVRRVLEAAFPTAAEADLVAALWRNGGVHSAFVAEVDGRVVGHVLYSPMELEVMPDGTKFLGLAPLAVHPEWQKRGVGAALVEWSLRELRNSAVSAVFVLGNPKYYARFGFEKAGQFGIKCEFKVPEELFMVLELKEGILDGCSRVASYRAEFRELG